MPITLNVVAMTSSAGGNLAEHLDPSLDLAGLKRAKGIAFQNLRSSALIHAHFLQAIEVEDYAQN